MEKVKLKEPEFKSFAFNGFGDPNKFAEEISNNLRSGEIYFNYKREWNPIFEFWFKNKPDNKYTLGHQDFLVVDENNNFETITSSDFNKKYSVIEKST